MDSSVTTEKRNNKDENQEVIIAIKETLQKDHLHPSLLYVFLYVRLKNSGGS
ncbi:MAG TPA: hypothetical protein VJ799_00540 [Nitrososphaeraceae archaeon]|nr:hypothetical protein [Nitrososphaeraceae archaeon]